MTGFVANTGKIGHMWTNKFVKCSQVALRWSSASNNLIGLLTVGNLIGTGVTIGNYVVEWHQNNIDGPIVLVSGIGPDPTIQSFHPLVNEVVPGGTLYAVIRYVFVDGIRYSPLAMQGQYSPDLKTCLGSINVVTMNCSNGGNYIGYTHYISYTNTTQSSTLATRILRFDLNNDGTTNAMAFKLDGFEVADRLQFYYVSGSTETLLKDWVVGTDNVNTNFATTPKKYKAQTLQSAFKIDPLVYIIGDYIKIVVSPSYNQPLNTNTNWGLYLKCFTTAVPFNCVYLDNEVNTHTRLNEWNMVWEPANCRYMFTYYTVTGYTQTQRDNMDIYRFMTHSNYNHNNFSDTQSVQLLRSTNGSTSWARSTGTYVESTQPYTISKTGSTLLFQFQNVTDYNVYKNGYNLSLTNAQWLNYSADTSDINHFKFMGLYYRVAPSLGDAFTMKYIYWNHDSIVTLNDSAFTITVNMVTTSSTYLDSDCNSTKENIDSWVNLVNSGITAADFSLTSKVTETSPLGNLYIYFYSSNPTTVPNMPMTQLEVGVLDGMCDLGPDWYLNGPYWQFHKNHDEIRITNVADPVNNWSLYTKLNADGSVSPTWTLVKSIP